jgi:two-component system cell cycle sensor histidine kinase/response regulator CckA
MKAKNVLSAEILGQIALIQGMVAHLPDKEQVMRFVCRGLKDIPGVDNIDYVIYRDCVSPEQANVPKSERLHKIEIKLEGCQHGELIIHISDADMFDPYIPFLENLGNMLAVLFEERRQRRLNKLILENLEKRVYERTEALELEIKERKQVEEALRESEENLRITLNSIGDAVISTDTAGNITRMNMVAETLTGWKQNEAIGKPLTAVFHIIHGQTRALMQNPVEKVLKARKIVGLAKHTVLVAKDGTEYQIADSGAPIWDVAGNITGVVLVFRDVTKQLETAHELLKAKKLESVGILAGGIAHDFNNLLTGLFGNIELARMFLSEDHKSYKFLKSAEDSMENAVNLTKQLLTFARGGDPIKETVSIGEMLVETAKFSMHGSQAKLQTTIAPDLWSIRADKGQLSQVISNLIINAQQAMPTGGTITVTANNAINLGERYVQITIQDEGVGIAFQHREKIFDPYFSTKEKGNGLGLAMTHSIIRKHDGRITVDSQPGQGSVFTIYLPAVENLEEEPVAQSATENPALLSSSARILIMDDDKAVREMLGKMLNQMGYEVSCSIDGQEAVAKYQAAWEKGSPYDVVITDLTIPGGMGGQAAAQEILNINPQAKIIVSSGYATNPILANYEAYGFTGIAAKPYHFVELQKVVQQTLSSGTV